MKGIAVPWGVIVTPVSLQAFWQSSVLAFIPTSNMNRKAIPLPRSHIGLFSSRECAYELCDFVIISSYFKDCELLGWIGLFDSVLCGWLLNSMGLNCMAQLTHRFFFFSINILEKIWRFPYYQEAITLTTQGYTVTSLLSMHELLYL